MFYISLALVYLLFSAEMFRPSSIRGKRVEAVLLLLPIFTIVAFRDVSVGKDTISYYNSYYRMTYTPLKDAMSSTWMEMGYILTTWILSRIGVTYYQFQILTASLYCYAIYKVLIDYSLNTSMSCFYIVTNSLLFSMMNQTRMWIAISICSFAIKPLVENRLVRFIIIVFLAMQFHTSALTFLFVYPFKRTLEGSQRIGLFRTVLLTGGIVILSGPILGWFTRALGRYENYTLVESGIRPTAILGILTSGYLLILLISNRQSYSQDIGINKQLPSNTRMQDLMTLGLTTLEFSLISNVLININMYFGRAFAYYSGLRIPIIPTVLECQTNKEAKFLTKSLYIGLCLIMLYITIKYRPDADMVYSYKFFLQV